MSNLQKTVLFFLNSQDKPKIAFGKKTFYGLNNQ